MRLIQIDSDKQEIRERHVEGGADALLPVLQACVGGYIETAHVLPNGDYLFVDEDGLFKKYENGFRMAGARDPFLVGSGVIVGGPDREGNETSARSSLQEIRERVQFCSVEEFRLLLKGGRL